ncbi:MAG TPA: insulinase family protein, partial [Bacteroidia bacterium]|nr:insulinase family protein [Bacteroidia bacterium]
MHSRPRLRHWFSRAALCIIGLVWLQFADAQQGQWQQRTLPNGLTVRYCQDSTRHLLHLGLTLRGGASLDATGTMGLAHLYEHLFFQHLPDSSPATEGIDQGIFISHNTQLEAHFFGLSIAPAWADAAFEMMGSGLRNNAWDEASLQAAKAAIATELQIWENAPENHLGTELQAALWKQAASQKHVLGSYSDILRLGTDAILKATAAYRHPGNCLLAATGNGPAEAFFDQAAATLGEWHSENETAPLPRFAFPDLEKSLYFTTVNEFAAQPLIMVAWPVAIGTTPAETSRDALAFCKVASLKQGTLHQSLVGRGLAHSLNWSWAGGNNPGQLLLYVLPVQDSLAACLQAIQTGLVAMAGENGIRKEDVAVANRLMRLQAAQNNDQSMGRLIASGQAWLLSPDSLVMPTLNADRMRNFCKTHVAQRPHVAGLLLSSTSLAEIDPETSFREPKPALPVTFRDTFAENTAARCTDPA